MFLPVSVCPSVCLSVCPLDYSKSYDLDEVFGGVGRVRGVAQRTVD